MVRKGVRALPFISDRKPVFFPGQIKKRNNTVVENIEKINRGTIAGAGALRQQGGVVERHYTFRAGQTHEVDLHPAGTVAGPFERLHFAGGKSQSGIRDEPHNFRAGRIESPHGRFAGEKALQKANGLKELKEIRRLPEFRFHRGDAYIRMVWPARGGHCFSTSLRWRVLTTS